MADYVGTESKSSPCLTCSRVRDPDNCENKLCKDWQAWFIDRWETMRANVFSQVRQQKAAEQGAISVGGRQYSHPEHVRSYLRKDPCRECICPKDLCSTPCAVRKAWDAARSKEGMK